MAQAMLLTKFRHSRSGPAAGGCSSGRGRLLAGGSGRGSASFAALAGASGEGAVTVKVHVHSVTKQNGSFKDAVTLLERSRMTKAFENAVVLVAGVGGSV